MSQELANKGWEQMEHLLDKHLPVKRRRRVAPVYWISIVATIIALSGFIFIRSFNEQSPTLDQTPETTIAKTDKPQHTFLEQRETNISEFNQTITTDQADLETPINSSTPPSDNHTANISSNNVPSDLNETMVSNKVELAPVIESDLHKTQPGAVKHKSSTLTENHTSKTFDIQVENGAKENALPIISSNDLKKSTDAVAHMKQGETPAKSLNSTLMLLPFADIFLLNPSRLTENNLSTKVIQPVITNSKTSSPYSLSSYARVDVSSDITEGLIGVDLTRKMGKFLSMRIGIAYGYGYHDAFEADDIADVPTEVIFTSSLTYSGYLADNQIAPSSFLKSTSTLYLPFSLGYNISNNVSLRAGFQPGIQFHRRLTYAPIQTVNSTRNPQIGNGQLTARDYFYQKSIGVLAGNIELDYSISNRVSAGLLFNYFLSDVNRGIHYADPDHLESIEADEVDRRFYSIDEQENKPASIGLKLSYKF